MEINDIGEKARTRTIFVLVLANVGLKGLFQCPQLATRRLGQARESVPQSEDQPHDLIPKYLTKCIVTRYSVCISNRYIIT